MAQKYEDNIEIAIIDSGRGILASLKEKYAIEDASSALREAIRPGVTRVQGLQGNGDWNNSGFGLYVISELGRRYGEFAISSSGCSMKINGFGSLFIESPLQGTAIKLRFNTANAEYFVNILKSIIDEGEKISENAGIHGRASMSSRTY